MKTKINNEPETQQSCLAAVSGSCKLELKHFSPYAPYKLKVFSSSGDGEWFAELMTGADIAGLCIEGLYEDGFDQYKPILRLLTSMTDEEKKEFNNTFIKISDENILPSIKSSNITNWYLTFKSIEMYNWLLSKHFDVFGLIGKGLAIDSAVLYA